ncbi:MAG TPA: ABC transporter permease [Acidobacteriota bacterium]|jgi:hypothetical protein
MDTIRQDIRYGLRMLLKSPGFAAVTILTLALGIGSTTAIFSVVEALLLRSLPYADPGRLILMWGTGLAESAIEQQTSPQDFADFKQRARSFESMAAASIPWTSNLSGTKDPRQVGVMFASGELFSLLGVRPQLGRDFQPSDDRAGAERVAMLSHALWESQFGLDRNILGRPIALNGDVFRIVGVMPAGFQFMEEADLWVPLAHNPIVNRGRAVRFLNVIARLRPQVSIQQAARGIRCATCWWQARSGWLWCCWLGPAC